MSQVPSFIGPSNVNQSSVFDGEDTLNWYLETSEQSATKNRAALYPTPGQTTWLTNTEIGGRALLSINGLFHGVIGGALKEFSASAVATLRGAVAQDSNPATISYNGPTGNQLFITSGGNGYVLNLTSHVLTEVLTGGTTMGGMIDGYFIAFNATTSSIRISNLNDGLTWDPTQFQQRNNAPDPWVAMLVNAPDIWLVGEQSTDVWRDSGAFPFPLEPRPGASFKYGTPAPFSVWAAGDTVGWLSQSATGAGLVVQARGYNPAPVSTKALETAIAGYARTSRITNCEALTYQAEGHTFAVFNFPGPKKTHVYDLTTGQWHRRGRWNPVTNDDEMWTPRVHAYAFGKHFVADRTTGNINILDVTTPTEADGAVIRRERIAPGMCREQQMRRYPSFQLYLDAGLGTATGQGSDPQVMLRTSDDGGKTYSNERLASAGKMGEYGRRVYWTRLGASMDRVYKVSVTDPSQAWRLIDGWTP